MDRTIRVRGRARTSLVPDTTVLNIGLSGGSRDYGETVKQSSEKTAVIKSIFEKLGFSAENIRTASFNIYDEYESYRDENGEYKNRFKGYRFDHRMVIRFASDQELLGRCLYAMAHCDADPEFHIEYTVKDSEGARSELIGEAVRDAARKAALIASAAGVELGDLICVDHDAGGADLYVRPVGRLMNAKMSMAMEEAADAAYGMDVTPENIQIEDSVTAVWEIKGL
ncbi:MAG: SIMPL domain-containing protein [Firmicutes bacterium]|nr:SIMPL domain-containing protein [Bacillota bacterium]